MSLSANRTSLVQRALNKVELLGNRLPHPTLLFVYLSAFILVLSAIAAGFQLQALHPISGETISAVNLLSVDGLHKILANTVTNFTHFAPVGTVLVAMLGIGVAEKSGLFDVALRASVRKAPSTLLTAMVVFTGVMSSIAADAGYVVLIPLAAIIFQSAGRHPLAGIAAAFAGVSGGYSANLLIGPVDAMLAGLSTEAAHLVAQNYQVSATANYYFMVASTFLVTFVGTWITQRWIEPRLLESSPMNTLVDVNNGEDKNHTLTQLDKRGLRAVGLLTIIVTALLLWGLVPADGLLRNPETGSILRSPFIQGIVVIIAVYALLAGVVFARVSGRWHSNGEAITAMESAMASMASYLVLMFFAAQFVSYFAWSNLGAVSAIQGAQLLQSWDLSPTLLLAGFVVMAASINLLIGSASAKWALLAPIFVPMLLLAGISPEATQMAFRVGDSSTNIITPLMPYFGVVVAYVQRYQPTAGIGTIMSMMLPYSVGFLIFWSGLMVLWLTLGLPLGPS
ncbi:AbgT family transporter [Thalassolituus sp.]|uniref:AbgT family transporter n=1 Tax=Thalassolituus sp. TaxID=2030822 RepID=UPI002A836310|nr:AbgT family transporter [Thalassolituus sp.]